MSWTVENVLPGTLGRQEGEADFERGDHNCLKSQACDIDWSHA